MTLSINISISSEQVMRATTICFQSSMLHHGRLLSIVLESRQGEGVYLDLLITYAVGTIHILPTTPALECFGSR